MTTEWTKASIARTIDHTLLKAIATEQQVHELCVEAKANGFASVCINPGWVPLCARELANSKVLVCTVIGFPLGANATETKAFEAALAVKQGADEATWSSIWERPRPVTGRPWRRTSAAS